MTCRPCPAHVVLFAVMVTCSQPALAREPTREEAMRAAIHPVTTVPQMDLWLSRVPMTREFPPDFWETLASAGSASVIEMTTAPGCLPCGDMWTKLNAFRARYHWRVSTVSGQEAMLRSGRLGLPWVGFPVVWVRPLSDNTRTIPIAIGTDHGVNLARNAYLATKMLAGVKPEVALRAMAKFTGIVGVPAGGAHR